MLQRYSLAGLVSGVFAQGSPDTLGPLHSSLEGFMVLYTSPDPSAHIRERSRVVGWLLLAFTVVTTLVLSLLPAPYVIDQPGPTYDTLGEVETDQGAVALIAAPGTPEYPQSGQLRLTTVTRVGNPDSLPSWWSVMGAWVTREKSVMPVDAAFPPGRTVEQNREVARIDMENSQQEAIAAAFGYLNTPYTSFVRVESVIEGGPSEGVIREGDIIAQAAGVPVADVTQLRALIAENGVQEAITITVNRGGSERQIPVIPRMSDGPRPIPAIGVLVSGRYEFSVPVEIQLENVGGPSAGLIFALGVVEKLTPEEVVPPAVIAGTGTITASGEVGGVGGVRHKAFGAAEAGARLFLIPRDNCDQVRGVSISGMDIVPVDTLEKAVDALAGSRGGAPLPSCSG
jgi:PDZ domain-containing protein